MQELVIIDKKLVTVGCLRESVKKGKFVKKIFFSDNANEFLTQ